MSEQLKLKNWEDVPALMTIRQFREVTGLSRVAAYELAHTKGFPVVRLNRGIKIHRDKARRWLDEQAAKNA